MTRQAWALALAAIALAGCARRPPPPQPAAGPQPPKPVAQALPEARISVGEVYFADPQGKWQVSTKADQIHVVGEPQRAELTGVEGALEEVGRVTLQASAKRAVVYFEQKRIVFEGDARSQWPPTPRAAGPAASGGTLQAQRIEWDMRSRQVRAEGQVRFSSPQVTATGSRFWADMGLRHIRMTD